MESITLKQLRYFTALADHRHFGRAAERCAISQPALSVQIKELEASLGAVLFERSARSVRLTRFGEAFAARVEGILTRVDELGDLARAAQERLAGPLRLGVIPTIAPYLLPSLLGRLAQSHRDLELDVRESLTGRLIEEIQSGQLDAAILALPSSEPWLAERALFSEPFYLVRPGRGEDARPAQSDEMNGGRLLLLEEGHCFRDQALSFCNLSAGARAGGLGGSSLSTLVQMVGAGMGVTVIPQIAVAVETRSAAVHAVRFAPPEPMRTVGLVWRRSSPLTPHFEALGREMASAAAGLLGQDGHGLPDQQ